MDKLCYYLVLLLLVLGSGKLMSQRVDSLRQYNQPLVQPMETVEPGVYPPSWWTGMEYDTVELMFHARDIARADWSVEPKGLQIVGDNELANPNYRFLSCYIPPSAKITSYSFTFSRPDKSELTIPFEILGAKQHRPQTLSGEDVMYLIMPDRFANGNVENDVLSEMKDQSLDRSDVFQRHGGDFEGLRSHMNYLEELGVSAIWLNPVLENDQALTSYHGYAITDHYAIDPRFGSNADYTAWTADCRSRGMKVVMDVILNHCGSEHFMIRDLPDTQWVHSFPEYTKCNFRAPVLMDPYASQSDKDRFQEGWFDLHMPDLNQDHPSLARFLIQNSLWWIEYAKLDAYRVDTYPYPKLEFTNEWNEFLLREYPTLSIFGETWVNATAIQAYFSERDHTFPGGSNAPSLTDFQLHFALLSALTEDYSWTSGVSKLYLTLAQDFIYHAPELHVTFLDNHDKNRIWSELKGDMDRWKMGVTFLMTLRGIPCLYYGTEILLEGEGGAFGEQGRVDFPGGWPSDDRSAFYKEERTAREQEAFQFIQHLIHLRHKYPALSKGKLTQFIPEEGLYVFARTNTDNQFISLVNTSEKDRIIDPKRYDEVWRADHSAFDHISGRRVERKKYTLKAGATQLIQIGDNPGIIDE